MNKYLKTLLLLIVTACGGGGGGGGSVVEPQSNSPISPYASSQATQDTVQNQTQYVSGKIIDDYIAGATVFIDTNNNEQLDDGEPSTVSDNFGNYSLPFVQGRLISIGGIDIGTQQPVDGLTLSSPLDTYTETKMITPVTTLLETEEDEEEIKEALGIPEYLDLNTADPVVEREREGGDDTLYEVGNQITVMALSLQEVVETQSTEEESTLEIIKTIAQEIKEKKKESVSGTVSLESTEIVDKVIEEVLTAANVEIAEDKVANVTNAVANLVSTISSDQDDEAVKAVLSFGVTTFLSDVVEIVEGRASDEKLESYNSDKIIDTLSATLSIDVSRLRITDKDQGLGDDLTNLISNPENITAISTNDVEEVIQNLGNEVTAEDLIQNNLGSNDDNEDINNILAELIQDAPEDVQEPQLSVVEQMVADYQAQLEAIAAEEAAAKAADENAPPKIANVYVWYMNSNRLHFGEGDAGKSAMDTRIAYMFEIVNEMYKNQRIKLEWNIVGSDWWGNPLSDNAHQRDWFDLWYSNFCANAFDTPECQDWRTQQLAANDAAEADFQVFVKTKLSNNDPGGNVTGVAGVKGDWDDPQDYNREWENINILSGWSTGLNPEEQEAYLPGSTAPEIHHQDWYDFIRTLWHELGHTMCAKHSREENASQDPQASLCMGAVIAGKGDTLMNSYGEMRVPPDQVISQAHPASDIQETSGERTCVPMNDRESEPVICQNPYFDGDGDGNNFNRDFDSGTEMARDLFNEWSYYYANLWEHRKAQLEGNLAGDDEVILNNYDQDSDSPAFTARMVFPLIDGGTYTYTNGSVTKKMVIRQDDAVVIDGVPYEQYRFYEELEDDYCGYVSYALHCSTREAICADLENELHPSKHNCPVDALGHGPEGRAILEGERRWADGNVNAAPQTVFRFRVSPNGDYFLAQYDDNKNWTANDDSNIRSIYKAGPPVRYDLESTLGCPFLSANFSPGNYVENNCSFKSHEYQVDGNDNPTRDYLAIHTFEGKVPRRYAKETDLYTLPFFSGVEKRYKAVSVPYGDFITIMQVQQQYATNKEGSLYFNKFYLHPEVGIVQFEHHGNVWQLVSADSDGDGMDNNFVGEDDNDNDGVVDQFDAAPLDPNVQ